MNTKQTNIEMKNQIFAHMSDIFKDKDLEYISEIAKKVNKVHVWEFFIIKMLDKTKHQLSLVIKKSEKNEDERFLFFRRILNKTEIQMEYLYSNAKMTEKYCPEAKAFKKVSSVLLNPLYFINEPSRYDENCPIDDQKIKIVTECVLKSGDTLLLKKLARLIGDIDAVQKMLPTFIAKSSSDESHSPGSSEHYSPGERYDQLVDDRAQDRDMGHEWH